jgi:hypothetical protein
MSNRSIFFSLRGIDARHLRSSLVIELLSPIPYIVAAKVAARRT